MIGEKFPGRIVLGSRGSQGVLHAGVESQSR